MQTLNPLPAGTFKAYRLLQIKKHRIGTGTCLIEGKRFVAEALRTPGTVRHLLVTPRFAGTPEGKEMLLEAQRVRCAASSVTGRQLASLADTVTSQGVLAVIGAPGLDAGQILSMEGDRLLLVAIERVADPGNLGTIIRTCAWFGADGVLLSDGSVELSNPKLLRSTMGAVFRVPVATGVDLADVIPAFRRNGFAVLAAAAGGEPAPSVLERAGKRLLVFGNEAHGLSPGIRSLADAVFGIRGSGLVESLNLSVAVGVALHIALAAGVPSGRAG
jgi:TrmH family RNA methyltransferase